MHKCEAIDGHDVSKRAIKAPERDVDIGAVWVHGITELWVFCGCARAEGSGSRLPFPLVNWGSRDAPGISHSGEVPALRGKSQPGFLAGMNGGITIDRD